MLNKKWNPYVHRHSTFTEKSKILSSDAKLRQFAGWTANSNMHRRYVHFRGNESQDDLLKAKGIIKDDKIVSILQSKTCPHCREPNKPDAQFCFKCNFVMSFEAYQKGMEERERKNQEILELKEQVNKMNDLVGELNHAVQFYKPVFDSVMKQLNPHLDPSGFEISPFNDQTTDFLRRQGMKETSTTQG